MTAPPTKVSILIPNFNNGRDSSRCGSRDFLGDLLASLHDTLADDPTPIEIIIADDGSTDDSLETCRSWATRIWGGCDGPFCRLIELEHCGVLSVVANRLMAEATGAIACRLDGDVVVHTPRWAETLVRIFETGPPDLGVVGPRQLSANGFLHAAGDWLLHPRGYHHVAQGIAPDAVPRAAEVDHVMGCFYCMRRAVWDQVGEYDETILRGQTVDYGVRARLAGWRCWYAPTISFTHFHEGRVERPNVADTTAGMADSRERFREKWGFDRLAPDLDEVARRYAGTPLLWNARVFGPATAWPPPGPASPPPESTHWFAYGRDDAIRRWADARVELARQIAAPNARVLQVGCGDGLACHLLAAGGLRCAGVERDPGLVEVARTMTAQTEYPASRPAFEVWSDLATLPAADRTADAVLVFDVVEWHPNPVGLLAEIRRVLEPGGALAILTRQRPNPLDEGIDHLHRYRAHELNAQVRHAGGFEVVREARADQGEMLLLVARRVPDLAAGRGGGREDGRVTKAETSSSPRRTAAAAT